MNSKYRMKLLLKSLCFFLILLAPASCFALESVRFAIRELCQHIEGNLGGLLMVAAGVGGMISAAFGNMKALYSCIITGIAAFSASTMLSLYFQEAYSICTGNGGGGGANQRTKIESSAQVSKIDEVSALNSFLKIGNSKNSEDVQIATEEDGDADLF